MAASTQSGEQSEAPAGDAHATGAKGMLGRARALGARAVAAPGMIGFELRRRRIARRYLRGQGLEIGALHCPLHVPTGATVRYVDRMGVADLYRHYPELREHRLVEVDVIDDGETLSTQPDGSADFIIANHFIEHTEDPLGTLDSHLRVLRPAGVLYMAVPDRRHTFDRWRPATGLQHVICDHREGPAGSRSQHQEEWARLVEQVPAEQVPARVQALEREDYSIHFHVWTPDEFAELLRYARDEAQLPFAVELLQGNKREFIAILRRT